MEISELIKDPNAVFISNDSGGKDSQRMYLKLKGLIPHDRLFVIHAHLPEVEWEGTAEFIRGNIDHELFVVQANKTFFEMVRHRGMFPSAKNRQCTSDLKRNPIQKKIREICNTHGFTTVVNCMGLRAEESPRRAKREILKLNQSQTNSKRIWYEWLPIHGETTEEVFQGIKDEGQQPFWTYGEGMSRKSCSFCMLANEEDLCIAARLRPKLLERFTQEEQYLDHTFIMPSKKKGRRFLREVVGKVNFKFHIMRLWYQVKRFFID